MSLNENVNINTILNNLRRELDRIESTDYYIELIAKLDQVSLMETDKEIVDSIKIGLASFIFDLKDFKDYWSNYCRIYSEAVEKDVDDANSELEQLRIKYNTLIGRYKQLLSKEEQLNKQIETLDETIKILQKNTKLIAGSVGARKRMVANTQPVALKTNIKDDELIEVYKNNGYKITEEMLKYFNKKEKITYDGLRKRLQRLGIWKGYNNK